ncbi:MAG: Rne/Rng family ribonuclease [Bacteriovoracaceae bacterium]|jgi:ribonuclease G|nr:Rne/Rng family ribonuclease [Bacteriovoracaceae bacterium]
MAKELIINQTLNETRIAFMDNGAIVDYLIDRVEHGGDNRPIVGNIYKGKVIRVLPGMQSAFVDIGWARAAFLYVDDAYIPTLEEQREMAEKLRIKKEEEEKARKKMDTIPDELSTLSESVDMTLRPDVKIEDFLKEGEEILVQVAKEPISTKGPRITRHITLAGRHIVYMPFIEHIGVSRRIENEDERIRLKEVIEGICQEGTGVIARTVAEGQALKTLKADYQMLSKIWKEIDRAQKKAKASALVHTDLDFIQRAIRDITDQDVDQILVDSKTHFKQVEKFINKYLPQMKGKVKLFGGDVPIFEQYGIEIEVERALGNKIYLKSGGSINIDQTEALVSVDVNTGKFVGKRSLEDTILQTNLEAIKEIAYQLRLRNCGGIIIIDFIDMEREEHREQVYLSLLEVLKKDRAKTNVLPISNFGLVEMTRKRIRDTLTRVMCESCPYCEGTGTVKTVITVCYDIVREAAKTIKKSKGKKLYIYAHPEVSSRLCGEDIDIIESLGEVYNKQIILRAENNYHIEQYEIIGQEF